MGADGAGGPVIEEDHGHEARFLRAQKAAWAAMALFLGLSFAGVTGPGIIGKDTVLSADGRLKASFHGVTHVQRDTEIELSLAGGNGRASLWVGREYADSLYIKQISPRPDAVKAAPGRLIYEFASGGAELRIVIMAEPTRPGRLKAWFGSGGSVIEFTQTILP